MKTRIFTIIASSAVVLASSAAFAATGDEPKSAVQVVFHEPENFSDFKTTETFRSSDAEGLQEQFTREIERAADRALPPGYVLTIRFNDIDLAGEVNPFQRVNLRDVREYRSVYPPRLSFDYSVTDTEGTVVLSGSEKLVDLAYDMQIRMPNRDYTRIETDMVRDFVRGLGRKIAQGNA